MSLIAQRIGKLPKNQPYSDTRNYTVFYKENGEEKSIKVEGKNQFNAKFKALNEHNIPLQSISRVL